MRYAIHYENDARTEATIFLEDGGIATIHHNGEHLLTTTYQDKPKIFNADMWDVLSEGSIYINDWENKQSIDREVIEHALNWLCPFQDTFTFVDFSKLVQDYNKRKN